MTDHPHMHDETARRITALLCRDSTHEELFAELAEILLALIPADRFSLGTSVLNRWHIYQQGRVTFDDYTRFGTIKEGFSASSWVLYNNKPMLRSGFQPDQFEYDEELLETGFLSDLILPLNYGGQTIGTANFTCTRAEQLNSSHQAALEPLLDLVTLCAVRIQDELDRQAVRTISQAVQGAHDLDEVLRQILTHIQSQGYDRVRVYLLDHEKNVLRGTVEAGHLDQKPFDHASYPVDEDPYSSETFSSVGPCLYRSGTRRHTEWMKKSGKRSILPNRESEWAEIPLRGQDDHIVGKISIDNGTTGRPLIRSRLDQLMVYAAQAAIAIQQASMRQNLELEVERRTARLQESQRRHRNLFENMQDGAAYHQIILDDEGTPIDYVFLEANKAFEKLTGRRRSEIVGRRVTEILPTLADSEFDWIGNFGRVAESGGVRAFEQYAEPLGKWLDVSAYSPEQGYFVAIFQDVTERREALDSLKHSEMGLRQRSELQQALLRISNRVQQMTSPDDLENVLIACLQELIGLGVRAETMAVHRVVDPDTLCVWTCRVNLEGILAKPGERRSLAITEEWQNRQIVIANDTTGEDFESKFGGIPILSCLDVPYSLGIISVHSTTKQAFSEADVEHMTQVAEILSLGLTRVSDLEELETQTGNLIASETKWRSLVENASDIIMTVDRTGKILFINYEVPGTTLEETIGTTLYDHTEPEYHDIARACLQRVFETRVVEQIETRAIGIGGETRWYLSKISPIVSDGVARTCHIISRDITDLKTTERELLRLERFRALGEMSAGVSHNLNNILTGIMGPAELLTLKTEDPEVLADAALIHKSATRARDLVRRLDRSVKGTPETPVPVDVNQVVLEALEISRPRWKDEPEAAGTQLEVRTHLGDVERILASVSGLTDIIVNLMFNAIDALPQGGRIDVTTEADVDAVILTVADNGVGMDQTIQAKVFEPFFTTKADVGTGLGLSTVYGSVVRWGGSIDLVSRPGQGSTFKIRFPVCTATERVEVVPALSEVKTASARVIVVDDESIVREVISQMVSVHHEVTTFSSAEWAMEAFAVDAYDVALIDLGMPGIPGDQLALEINRIDPNVATVLVSGWMLEPEDERLLAFDLQLVKPLDNIGLLNRTLSEALQISLQRRHGPDHKS